MGCGSDMWSVSAEAVTVSSVVPADPAIEVVGTAPDLGPTGDRLTVVQGRCTRSPDEDVPAVAGLGWARSDDGPGIFYEASGDNPEAVRRTVEAGLDHGVTLRDWAEAERETVVRLAELDDEAELEELLSADEYADQIA